ncbi:putative redox protein [Rubricella aquisinus]|uniref:Putative redox protein n=1 Tax=Rubricella aquisinus TaxID=2028108 RepID=A0A840WKP9_9RHOB|nr:bifunctional alpha/beta hydrolase/OsmC family protein [Rubricella aquisinus]MBB5514743.1 putative redox protein [Rubricella aquisinus]
MTKTEKFTFDGHAGPLAGRLDLPVGKPKAVALFAHCFTCGKDITAARRIAGRLAALGIAVLRFDFTGLGHSKGEFGNTHFTSNIQDLVLAAKALEGQGMAPSLLIGHSLGGAAVLAAARDMPSVRAVVTIGAPADPAHVLHNFGTSLEVIEAEGEADVSLGGRPFHMTRAFLDDVRQATLKDHIAGLHRALLVLHAPRDSYVGVENATEIFVAAKHPKSFVTLDDADHLLTNPADAEYAAEVIESWSRRYLGLTEEPAPARAPEGIVRVTPASPDGFLHDIRVSDKHVLADEPASVGGTDLGLTPYQLVSAGLGACTSMTLRMYAAHKGWPLEDVQVDVSHGKVHLTDLGQDEVPNGKIDQWDRVITLTGPLDDDQRARLLEIADKCPVHRTLETESHVKTRLS